MGVASRDTNTNVQKALVISDQSEDKDTADRCAEIESLIQGSSR